MAPAGRQHRSAMRKSRDAISVCNAPRDRQTSAAMRLMPCLQGALCAASIAAQPVWAGAFDDLQVRWDNTITVSTEYALHNALPAAANYCALDAHETLTQGMEEGCVYGTGFHTARVDLLSQIDIDATDFGLHASAAGWYDGIDNNDDDTPEPGSYRT